MIFKKEGFTLLEILLAISILSIALIYTVPKIDSFHEEYKLYSILRQCVVDLKYAQQLSIDTKNEYGVYFTGTGYEIKFDTDIVKTVVLDGAKYIEIQGTSENSIVFKSSGEPYTSGNVIFRSDYSNKELSVKVTPETGEVLEN